jgi:hypothetical protein
MKRRTFVFTACAALIPATTAAHSPWGQYAVYRQKHLLVLSTRDDEPTYPYSKQLVAAINKGAPEASARPARAKDLRRAYELLRSDQFQFALLSSPNIEAMRYGKGTFAGQSGVALKTIFQFGTLEFVVRADFPEKLAAIVTDAVLESLTELPDAADPKDMLEQNTLHPGARAAIEDFIAHKG